MEKPLKKYRKDSQEPANPIIQIMSTLILLSLGLGDQKFLFFNPILKK